MFTSNTQLRREKADAALREIMSASIQEMFDNAAQVKLLGRLSSSRWAASVLSVAHRLPRLYVSASF